MPGIVSRTFKLGGVAVIVATVSLLTFQQLRAQDQQESTQNIMYLRGQSVVPSYEGWHPNPDGTIDLWFGYLNLNWQEELDIPVGPNNLIEPAVYGPDAGQPTHFLPRTNHWQFAIRVPKDFGTKEIVWTLSSHGQTLKTYATLKPGYIHDDMGMQREFFGTPPPGNLPPVLKVEGDKQRAVKVGQPITLTAVATDDGLPRTGGRRGAGTADDAGASDGGGAGARAGGAGQGGRAGGRAGGAGQAAGAPGGGGQARGSGGTGLGGDSVRGVAKGLRLAWYVYRGANMVTFDPPQFKVWEDQRGGSPWAPTWVNPPIPEGNKWIVRATFSQPGTYVLRCQASDGLWNTNENVTFSVTP
jgi:hypothetical protein